MADEEESSSTNCSVTTLFASNLDPRITEKHLEGLFGEIGHVQKCRVIANQGIGFITFATREEATFAKKNVTAINERKLYLKFAKGDTLLENNVVNNVENDKQYHHSKQKKGRLIIRNLSFKIDEKALKEEFEKYGDITEVNIPRKPDGKYKGFGFVQFKMPNCARNAIKQLNGKQLLGRQIAVDWSLSKQHYLERLNEQNQLNDDDDDDDDDSVAEVEDKKVVTHSKSNDNSLKKQTKLPNDTIQYGLLQDKELVDFDMDVGSESGDEEDYSNEVVSSAMNESLDDDDDVEKSGSEEMPEEDSNKQFKPQSFAKKKSDVSEGRTLFISNLSLDTTKEDLHVAFSVFGSLKYALICVNPLTEYPKGTGFVQFENVEDAKSCLQKTADNSESNEAAVVLHRRRLRVQLAISREELKAKEKEKNVKKDNRNLRLVMEGLVRPGTLASKGVSESDMAMRDKAYDTKMKLLDKITNMHVSATRLRICNLPKTLDDKALRKLFLKAGGNDAVIREARVMRSSSDKKAPSKGFGFVEFGTHEHAVRALRKLNNNPGVFSIVKRPIIEFSVENSAKLKLKEKRLERIRAARESKTVANGEAALSKRQLKRLASKRVHSFQGSLDDEVQQPFVGVKADLTMNKLPTRRGPKVRRNRTSHEEFEQYKEAQRNERTSRRKTLKHKLKANQKKASRKTQSKKKSSNYDRSRTGKRTGKVDTKKQRRATRKK